MLLVDITERYRADAQVWLSRAALMPDGSWDRERLTTAAKLNYAIAELIDQRNRRARPKLARLSRLFAAAAL